MKHEKINTDGLAELPDTVNAEHSARVANSEQSMAQQVETGTVSGSGPAPQTAQDNNSIPPPATNQQSDSDAQQSQVATPHIADDQDLIEKDWIESAKRIVEQTKGDPHARSESLGAVKSDYKKKRFHIDTDSGVQ